MRLHGGLRLFHYHSLSWFLLTQFFKIIWKIQKGTAIHLKLSARQFFFKPDPVFRLLMAASCDRDTSIGSENNVHVTCGRSAKCFFLENLSSLLEKNKWFLFYDFLRGIVVKNAFFQFTVFHNFWRMKKKISSSIKHDLARSCFQLWPKIGDEGDKISRKKLARR